jgi:ABC-type multidrug transport system fused ATPase/permease subunit
LSLAFNAIIYLVASVPVLILFGGTVAALFQMLIVALALASVALTARSADVKQLVRASSGILMIAGLVPLCIVAQLLPVPLALSHSIWASASEALQTGSPGHMTVDVGSTLGAQFSVLSSFALIAVTVLVARERRRAELVLFAAAAVSVVLALAVLVRAIGPLKTFAANIPADAAVTVCCCGVVINLAVIVLAYERHETRHQAATQFIPVGIVSLAGVLITAAALLAIGSPVHSVAAAFGVALFGLVFLIRRLDLTIWPITALCVAAVAAAAIMLGWLAGNNTNGPALLRFLPDIPSSSMAAIERMLAEWRWLGLGAGTFQKVAVIYQGSDVQTNLVAPTTAIAVAIELGWFGLLGAVAISVALLVKLFRGALKRGRDSFFPAAAAGCVATATLEALVGSGLSQPFVVTLLAILIGLGLSQGIGTARQ